MRACDGREGRQKKEGRGKGGAALAAAAAAVGAAVLPATKHDLNML